MRVAFIGLGIMGSRMAANLQKRYGDLTVYNRTRGKADALAAGGARVAESPAEAASGADALFTMLSTPEAVRETALGPGGFLDPMRSGSLWIDASTVDPAFSREMADHARRRGVRFVDAPAAGTKQPAERGELLFFAGGEERDVAEATPLLEAMGRKVIRVGGCGMGSSLKMVNNLLLAQAMVAFSEAVGLGEALGIPRASLLDTLIGSSVVAPYLSGKRGKFEEGAYDADFPLRWMRKDLALAARSAGETGAVLLSGSVAKELFAEAVKRGLGDEDFSAIFKLLAG